MADCIAAQVARETAVTGKTHKNQARSWTQWTTYCGWIGLSDPFLANFTCHAGIKLLRAFTMAMQEASYSRSSHVRLAKGSFSSAISHVCQTFCEHGQPNPSLDNNGKTRFLLQQELRAFKKADPAEKHQKSNPHVSHISPCKITALRTRLSYCPTHRIGHVISIQIL
jgi:hypothetical protein